MQPVKSICALIIGATVSLCTLAAPSLARTPERQVPAANRANETKPLLVAPRPPPTLCIGAYCLPSAVEPAPQLVAPRGPPNLCLGSYCLPSAVEPAPLLVAPQGPPWMCWGGRCPAAVNLELAG